MPGIFDEITINGMLLRNRLVRSATWEGMCEDSGRPTEELVECYRKLAKGGIGLIISGYTFVRPEGKQLPGKMGIYTDDFAAEFKRLTAAVHEENGRIALQLVHAGGQADSKLTGETPLAPSAVEAELFAEKPRELSELDIHDIICAFGEGARRAKAWGFDAVQLHGAHGYLINQFLSPNTNQRNDDYGGSLKDRSRFLFDVYREIRMTVGEDFPVMIKLNASDNLKGGLELNDALYAANWLSVNGIDAIEVSAGTRASGRKGPARVKISKPEREAYNLDLALQIKEVVDCPVISVGGYRSFEIAESAIANRGIDMVAMARPLIGEPALAARWQSGDRRPADCASCNSCFRTGMEKGGIYCVVERKSEEAN